MPIVAVCLLSNQLPKLRRSAHPKGCWKVHKKQDLVTTQSVPGTAAPFYSRALFLAQPDPEQGSVLWSCWIPFLAPLTHLVNSAKRQLSNSSIPTPSVSQPPASLLPLHHPPADGSLSSSALGTPRSTGDLPCWGPLCTMKSSVF